MSKNRPKKNRHLIGAIDLPLDVIDNCVRTTVYGDTMAIIENHFGIITYTEEMLSFSIEGGSVEVQGKALLLDRMDGGTAVVRGRISNIAIRQEQNNG